MDGPDPSQITDMDGDGDIDWDDHVLAFGELVDSEADQRQGLTGKLVGGKAPRPMAIIAVVATSAVTGGAVAALGYDLIVNGSETAAANLGQLSALGLGALVAVAGAGKNDKRNDGE